jgi:hypothetical protein
MCEMRAFNRSTTEMSNITDYILYVSRLAVCNPTTPTPCLGSQCDCVSYHSCAAFSTQLTCFAISFDKVAGWPGAGAAWGQGLCQQSGPVWSSPKHQLYNRGTAFGDMTRDMVG